MSSTPLINWGKPMVNRGWAAGFSRPMQAINKPSKREMQAFSTLALPMKTAPARPSTTSQKYSKDENFSAISASAGENRIMTMVPKSPPMAEKTRPAPSANSACPLSVMR